MTTAGPSPDRIRELFLAATAMGDATRDRYLVEQCADDPKLERRVRRMLAHDQGSKTNLLDRPLAPAAALPRSIVEPEPGRELAPGARLGAFTIERVVGVGGMGVVYRARQDKPDRPVAIKVLRAGHSTPSMLRRMELEVELLGRLRHPGIAAIYEAGSATDGQEARSYFAMEFIDGVAITEHARRSGLSTRSRVELIARVCDAVEHAHQRGVIHRDLKPGNILVDAAGEPKIVDFGVARATDPRLHLTTIRTSIGQLVGTLQYMSPEQIAGDPDKVDTRSDVYALGVILYQLLTGRLPYALETATIPEAARIIKDEPPATLSSIDRSLRGELDTIVARALAKDPSRRYQSAAALGEDLRRYLDGRPIVARADSAMYVLRTQLNRYRGVVAAACVSIIALTAIASYAVRQARLAEQSREHAEDALLAARQQTSAAVRERSRADAVAEDLKRELRVSTVERARLLGQTDNFRAAERTLWHEHGSSPSEHTYWALWELYSHGASFRRLPGDQTNSRAVAVSPDGSMAATGRGQNVVLWNTRDWSPIATRTGHRDRIEWMQFSPDGSILLSADVAGCVRTWTMPAGELADEVCLPGGSGAAAMAKRGFAPWPLAISGDDGIIRTYRVDATGNVTPSIPFAARRGRAMALDFDQTGHILAGAWSDGVVRTYAIDRPRPLFGSRAHDDVPYAVSVSPAGDLMATGGRDGVVYFWKLEPDGTASLADDGVLRWGHGTVRSLQFSSDGRHILIGGGWAVLVYDVATRAPSADYAPFWFGSHACTWAANETAVLATDPDGVRVWETRAGQHERSWRAHEGRCRTIAASPTEDLVATTSIEGQVRLWNTSDFSLRAALEGHAGIAWRAVFSPDGKDLATVGADQLIKIWNVASGKLDRTIKVPPGEFLSIAYSPDGQTIAGGARFDRFQLWDARTCEPKRAANLGGGSVACAFNPDGSTIAAHVARTTYLLHPETLEIQARFEEEAAAWCMAFLSPTTLAVAGWGTDIRIWDLPTGTRQRVLTGHARLIQALTLGPTLSTGERMLLSASADGTIKAWQASQGLNLFTLDPPVAGSVTGIAFARDGRPFSSHGPGTASAWDLRYYDSIVKDPPKRATEPPTASLP